MSRLVIIADQLAKLRADLLQVTEESCAVLYGRSVSVENQLARIVIREIVFPSPDAYSIRSTSRAQLKPEFVAEVGQRARRTQESVVFVHSHPFGFNAFSPTDDAGEKELAAFLSRRGAASAHAALLITPEATIARRLGESEYLRVWSVGRHVHYSNATFEGESSERYDRQIRAFGATAQRRVESIRIAIVGLGGTGSIIAEQLAHLGALDFVLVDPDTVEATNLNRLVGAITTDVGRPKVDVARDLVLKVNRGARVVTRRETVLLASVARSLANCDVIFGCTDSNGSRAVLNQVAYQYLVPTFDMGVVIAVSSGRITHIAGRVQLLAPGLACLTCGNLLDPEQVRRDMLTDFERQADPYIPGTLQPAPAVMSLNGTMASLAITMFLQTFAGIPGDARFINYNGLSGTMRPVIAAPNPRCVVCSANGAFARGDEWPLAARPG